MQTPRHPINCRPRHPGAPCRDPGSQRAPLDGQPDGERINIFTVQARTGSASHAITTGLGERVLAKSLSYAEAAFALDFVTARMMH